MTYYDDFDDFMHSMEAYFDSHDYGELNDDRREWLEVLWNEYNDDGAIDWNYKAQDDGFWYYYMTEVLGYDDEDIEKYFNA